MALIPTFLTDMVLAWKRKLERLEKFTNGVHGLFLRRVNERTMLCAGPYPSATIIYFVGVLRTKLRIYMFVAANANAKRELLATKMSQEW